LRQGYFLPEQEGAMLLTVTPAVISDQEDLAAAAELGDKLSQAAQDIFQQAQVEAVVQAAAVQPQIRERAGEAGLSTGKYSLMLEALAAGVEVSAADFQQESAARVLARYEADWQQLWHKLQQEKDLLQKEEQFREKLEAAVTKGSAPQGNAYGHPKGNAGKAADAEPDERLGKVNTSLQGNARGNPGAAEAKSKTAAVHNNNNGNGKQPANSSASAAAKKKTRPEPAYRGNENRPGRDNGKQPANSNSGSPAAKENNSGRKK
jgi:hypothetical protein